MPNKTSKRKSVNPYSGSGSNYIYDQSKTSPKSASANKYSMVSTPKSKSNQQKVSNEYQSEINKMRSTVRAYEPKASTGRKHAYPSIDRSPVSFSKLKQSRNSTDRAMVIERTKGSNAAKVYQKYLKKKKTGE